jgi:hypothetical protein
MVGTTSRTQVINILKRHQDQVLTFNELRKLVPKTIDSDTLVHILNSLEEKNKIYMSPRGIIWIENPSLKLKKVIKKGRRL